MGPAPVGALPLGPLIPGAGRKIHRNEPVSTLDYPSNFRSHYLAHPQGALGEPGARRDHHNEGTGPGWVTTDLSDRNLASMLSNRLQS